MTEPEQSLITDEHRATIGVKSEPASFVLREEDVRRMRDLLGDTDPRYADGTGIAPPYVLAGLTSRPDRRIVPMVLPRSILTQIEWRFFKPLRIGAELKAVSSVVDIRDRLGGRYGYSVLVMTQTEYLDADGEVVAASIQTGTQFDPEKARS